MSKPKQIRLDLNQKVDILKKIDSGVNKNRLAIDYGVNKSSITRIEQKRREILEATSNTFEKAKRKTLHKPNHLELEKKLYDWFLNQRARNCTVSGPMLQCRAKVEYLKLYPEKDPNSFTASAGWLDKFKKRHGIRYLKVCGEILSSDTGEITPFIHKLRAKMNEMKLTDAQLYNADESALFFRMLPEKTFVSVTEKSAPGRKTAKDRVTFLLCSNADGSNKVTPMVIGKSAKPRCFKGFENPVVYSSSRSAWMTSSLFKDWFHNSFVKEVKIFINFKIRMTFQCDFNGCQFLRFKNFQLKTTCHQKQYYCLITVLHTNPSKCFKVMMVIFWLCFCHLM